jgi:diacylglycerol kinase
MNENIKYRIEPKKLLHSFGFAFKGIETAFKTQQNFRIEIAAAFFTIAFGIMYKINSLEWLVILICIAFVLCLELVNTALENMCDVYSTAKNPTIKIIKDTAAAAVLVAAIISVSIALIIFLPKF